MTRQRQLGCVRIGCGLLAAFILLAILGGLLNDESGRTTTPADIDPAERAATEEPGPRLLPDEQRDAKLRALLADGNGNDWLKLSTQEKLELGQICADVTGRHTMLEYRDGLETFYQKAKAENSDLIEKPISEIAAMLAAQDLAPSSP